MARALERTARDHPTLIPETPTQGNPVSDCGRRKQKKDDVFCCYGVTCRSGMSLAIEIVVLCQLVQSFRLKGTLGGISIDN